MTFFAPRTALAALAAALPLVVSLPAAEAGHGLRALYHGREVLGPFETFCEITFLGTYESGLDNEQTWEFLRLTEGAPLGLGCDVWGPATCVGTGSIEAGFRGPDAPQPCNTMWLGGTGHPHAYPDEGVDVHDVFLCWFASCVNGFVTVPPDKVPGHGITRDVEGVASQAS